ncbi:outer membrane beta-barrel protein [Candidatus Nitrospira bockiana]
MLGFRPHCPWWFLFGALVLIAMRVTPVQAEQSETRFIPSLSVTERYDSNVFFVPGANLEDFVTTVAPLLEVEHRGRLIDGRIRAGVTSQTYAKNTGLNFVAANGAIDLNFDQAISQVIRGMKLEVTDAFRFTPEPPSFLTPQTGQGVVPDAFIRGIQASRANSFTNIGTAAAAYPLTAVTTLQGQYQHRLIRFGTAFASPEFGGFFDTTFQTLTLGPQFQVSGRDTLSLNYQYQQMDFKTAASSSGFTTNGGLIAWQRLVTPTLTADMSAGLTIVGGASAGNSVQYLANLGLDWKLEEYRIHAQYSRTVFPSFFIQGVPLLSQVLALSISHSFTQRVVGSARAAYALNESVPSGLISYESYTVSATVNYMITRNVSVSGSASHSEYTNKFLGQQYEFDRNMVSLTLTGTWN